MTQHAHERPKHDAVEIVTVLVLSITAVLTAWCGFEASKWGGEMSVAFSQASSARIEATDAAGEARDDRQLDLTIYAQWVNAVAEGNTELAEFIEARFTPEFRIAFDAWNADGRQEAGPFAMPEYVPEGTERAAELSALANAKFDQALVNNQRGDNYSLLTVLFALVLFLAAMSQREITRWATRTMLALAIGVAVAGIIIMATFPIRL